MRGPCHNVEQGGVLTGREHSRMSHNIRLDFLGAAGTVTGSRHLVTVDGKRYLFDCGLFQGRKEIRDLNWKPFPVEPASIEAVVVTHAHIDHIGNLPKLVKDGYKGPIYSTPATAAISALSLPDTAHLQEEEARFHNKRGSSSHVPALPLYGPGDAETALRLFERKPYEQWHALGNGLTWRYHTAGHILGAAFIELALPTGEIILFGGDLGRNGMPIIRDPMHMEYADYLYIESTYGDRLHPNKDDIPGELAAVVKRTCDRGGVMLIPAFAIGRSQEILYFLHDLIHQGTIPDLPIYLDSPMAVDATRIHIDFAEEHDLEMSKLMSEENPLAGHNIRYTRSSEESKKLNNLREPAIIISSSGMCNGGRILHHLLNRLDDAKNTVLFVGFQAEGTLGRRLIDGEERVRIYGQEVAVKAEIARIDALSAHADYEEMLEWLSYFKKPPKMTFIVHGEPPAAASLMGKVKAKFGWPCTIPYLGDHFDVPA